MAFTPSSIVRAVLVIGIAPVLSGLSLYFTQMLVAPDSSLDFPAVVARFAVAWLAGYAVVGAPAGLGVRDGMLVALLMPQLTMEQALMLALVHRAVSLAGDFALFAAGAVMQHAGKTA